MLTGSCPCGKTGWTLEGDPGEIESLKCTTLGARGAIMAAGEQKQSKAFKAVFYRTARGNEPVREFLDGVTAADRKNVGGDIGQVEWKWPKVSKPLVASFGRGLYEVRSSLRTGLRGSISASSRGR